MKPRRQRRIEQVQPRFKVWFSSAEAEGVFGSGRCRLLEAIDQKGSLRAAAESLGISYRKAWGDLRKTERWFGVKLLERRRGGNHGGDTSLTDAGRKWVTEYKRFQRKVERTVEKGFDAWLKRMRE